MEIEEAIRLVASIKWLSIDKDNMEFKATVSCYQVDAIRLLISTVVEACELGDDDGQPTEQEEWHDFDRDC